MKNDELTSVTGLPSICVGNLAFSASSAGKLGKGCDGLYVGIAAQRFPPPGLTTGGGVAWPTGPGVWPGASVGALPPPHAATTAMRPAPTVMNNARRIRILLLLGI